MFGCKEVLPWGGAREGKPYSQECNFEVDVTAEPYSLKSVEEEWMVAATFCCSMEG